ncbi:MAG: RidA family protein [Proteobacteria bacterium]|nr:MAG: RidA family protein [Pseudomonadota bacterium]TDJ73393.1 MAG: RidA family protein [Pseudomonadota bacterium]
MPQLQRAVVNVSNAPQPLGAYSQAIRARAGELVFIAGQVSVDIDGDLVGENDVAAQTRQVFDNLGRILAGVGASFSHVLEFTTYVVGREAIQPYMQTRMEIFPKIFPNKDYPPNTLLVVSGLVREEFLLEIKAVAALP